MATFGEPGTILGRGDTAVNKTDKVSSLKKCMSYRGRQKLSEQIN